MTTKSKFGFTLIELIVVISIIGLLATVGITSYTNVQKAARDSKRISDFIELVDAMTVYNIDNNSYPGVDDYQGKHFSSSCSSDLSSDLLSKGYLNKIPSDPLDNANCTDNSDTAYFYGFDSAHCCEASYCISINKLETQDAYDQLEKKYSNRLTVYTGCNANIGKDCTTERQFHLCFVPNP
ncbi:hypothetical protein COY16_04700 [Candidatus Roizmanbacteria bacterium CG_4_10_14_0_2_um_filter_39_13]|uniref:Type II secretion system protein GspG C-terminal domain-containing protein n=1 Tax=Candidatus Roizmanbacteria bacterium CG_4_10_14_0_2_um_filter_39_13 TaxID=1974825 RepID=A0A2M7TX33_9BACT|nr:MAG: hypothetical protein COY16_04700 [Candidatus Roizmanbacteria bacterium CG_4_10_14_0_2_um_filter_39_13]